MRGQHHRRSVRQQSGVEGHHLVRDRAATGTGVSGNVEDAARGCCRKRIRGPGLPEARRWAGIIASAAIAAGIVVVAEEVRGVVLRALVLELTLRRLLVAMAWILPPELLRRWRRVVLSHADSARVESR